MRVYRYFRANNTGYMVLHFEEGQSLKGWLKGLGRAPRQKELDAIIGPLLDALELIHKADFLHRDIAPDNIIIRKSGDPVLIDFGSARGEIASHTKTVSALVKPGYSPYEQYAETSRQQGPWSDIYALAGTLYHAITGKRPPDAPSRMVKDELVSAREAALSSYRAGFLKAIDRALALNVEARPQSIAAWRGDLLAPDPVRASWLTRTTDRRKDRKKEKEEAEAAPAIAATVPITPPDSNAAAPRCAGPQGRPSGFPRRLAQEARGRGRSGSGACAGADPNRSRFDAGFSCRDRQARRAARARLQEEVAVEEAHSEGTRPRRRQVAGASASAPPEGQPPQPDAHRLQAAGRRRRRQCRRGDAGSLPAVREPRVGGDDRHHHRHDQPAAATSAGSSPPPRCSLPLSPRFAAHRGSISGAAYTDDGRRIVTTGADGSMKIWDAAYRNLVRTIELDDGPATSLALNGARALTGHANGKVVLWDLDRAEKIATVQRNEANIWAVAFTGDPNRFAAASHDWKVTLWDARQTAAPLQVLDGHENSVQSLAYSPQLLLLASGSADKTVRVWNLDTLDLKRSYRGPRDFVTSVAFSPSGKLLAAGALDGRIQVWSVLSSRRMRTLNGHRGRVADIAFSSSGDQLASAGEDGTVRLWDLQRGRILRALTGHVGGATAVAFCARRAASGVGRRRRARAPVGHSARTAGAGIVAPAPRLRPA